MSKLSKAFDLFALDNAYSLLLCFCALNEVIKAIFFPSCKDLFRASSGLDSIRLSEILEFSLLLNFYPGIYLDDCDETLYCWL